MNNTPPLRPWAWLPNLLVLAFPAASLAIPHAANASLIAAGSISLCLCSLAHFRRQIAASLKEDDALRFCYAMCAPIVAVLFSEIWHGNFVASTFDTPSRFLLAIPIFLLFRTQRTLIAPWAGASFALGGIGAAAVVVLAPRDWGYGRIGSAFLNPIHFGDVATVFMVLSVASIHWLSRDGYTMVLIKLLGMACACYASLAGGSRGGWIALPFSVLLLVCIGMPHRTWKMKLAALTIIAALFILPFRFAPVVATRLGEIHSELDAMKHGNDDTNTGTRIKLYQASTRLFLGAPWAGLGANGFKNAMEPLMKAGVLTPHAAQLGRGETHNQIMAYAVDYGIPGLLASLLLYVSPWLIFWRQRHSTEKTRQRSSVMGLIFVSSFFVFGLTVDTFTLKATASIYAGILAILAALTSAAPDLDSAAPTKSSARRSDP